MGEIVGHAPLLFGLLLNNQNNNNGPNPANNNVNNGNGTVVLQDRVAEAAYLRTKQFDKDESILPSLYQPPNTATANRPFTSLTKAQIDHFNKHGYLVLPSILTTDETNALRNEAHGVILNINEGADDKIIHYDLINNNNDSTPRPSPIGNVVATFENPTPTPTPTTKTAPPQIARLGCGIHTLLPTFHSLTHNPFHRSLYTTLIPPIPGSTYTTPLITQSQLIIKSGFNKGSAVTPHQDGCISFTSPPSCLTYWYALEESVLENGCLEVRPRSHITEPLRQRVVKGERGEPRFLELEGGLWARGGEGGKSDGEVKYADGLDGDEGVESGYVPLEVGEGTLVLFHGNLMHKSGRNRSGRGRMAYTFSVIDAEAKSWSDGYMEPEDGELDGL